MKKLFCLAIMLSLFVLPALAEDSGGTTFRLHNCTSYDIVYTIVRLTHPFDYPGPFPVAGGELRASTKHSLNGTYPASKYGISWMIRYVSTEETALQGFRVDMQFVFVITPGITEVQLRPDMVNPVTALKGL